MELHYNVTSRHVASGMGAAEHIPIYDIWTIGIIYFVVQVKDIG